VFKTFHPDDEEEYRELDDVFDSFYKKNNWERHGVTKKNAWKKGWRAWQARKTEEKEDKDESPEKEEKEEPQTRDGDGGERSPKRGQTSPTISGKSPKNGLIVGKSPEKSPKTNSATTSPPSRKTRKQSQPKPIDPVTLAYDKRRKSLCQGHRHNRREGLVADPYGPGRLNDPSRALFDLFWGREARAGSVCEVDTDNCRNVNDNGQLLLNDDIHRDFNLNDTHSDHTSNNLLLEGGGGGENNGENNGENINDDNDLNNDAVGAVENNQVARTPNGKINKNHRASVVRFDSHTTVQAIESNRSANSSPGWGVTRNATRNSQYATRNSQYYTTRNNTTRNSQYCAGVQRILTTSAHRPQHLAEGGFSNGGRGGIVFIKTKSISTARSFSLSSFRKSFRRVKAPKSGDIESEAHDGHCVEDRGNLSPKSQGGQEANTNRSTSDSNTKNRFTVSKTTNNNSVKKEASIDIDLVHASWRKKNNNSSRGTLTADPGSPPSQQNQTHMIVGRTRMTGWTRRPPVFLKSEIGTNSAKFVNSVIS
jgi:hypothetical protein